MPDSGASAGGIAGLAADWKASAGGGAAGGNGPGAVRLTSVDAARGAAILMMVAYHIFFDLYYFGIADFGIGRFPLELLQYSTGTLFVLIAGVSLTLSESRNREGYAHHLKRGLLLGAVALAITLATWIYPHQGFIQFGIIHMIALSTLIAPFFFRFGRMNLVLGALIVLAGIWISAGGIATDTHWLFWLGIVDPSYQALDHYPMMPWFGVVLIGIWLGQTLFPSGKPLDNVPARGNPQLAFLGRNSLVIYLAHQPVLIGIIMALRGLGVL